MSDLSSDLSARLQELAGKKGILGASVLERDGIHELGEWNRGVNVDTLSAMSAAIVGAAEAALLDMGARTLHRVQVFADGVRLHILGLDDDFLLVVATEEDQDDVDGLESAAEGLRTLLAGG